MWRDVILLLEERSLPKRRIPLPIDEFELKDGCLYHICHLPEKVIHHLVIPRSLRQAALKLAHWPPLATHPDIYRTYTGLRNMFYFPNMLREVRSYIQTCKYANGGAGIT